MTNQRYAWVDLETTGTNERVDKILEAAFIITDADFNEIDKFEVQCNPGVAIMGRMSDYVRNMHTENGLIEDVSKLDFRNPPWKLLRQILLEHVNASGKKLILAGSGVSHFDFRFLKEIFPNWNQLFTYSPLDIGSVRKFMKIIGIEPPPGYPSQDDKLHRAMDDIELHLKEARLWKEHF